MVIYILKNFIYFRPFSIYYTNTCGLFTVVNQVQSSDVQYRYGIPSRVHYILVAKTGCMMDLRLFLVSAHFARFYEKKFLLQTSILGTIEYKLCNII